MSADQGQTDRVNERSLRRVLKMWTSLKGLGSQPLVHLEMVKARHHVAGYTHSPAGYGLALREVLQAAVETLRPDVGPPVPETKEWRPYLILTEQFVQGRSPEWVAEQLHIAKGTYYGEQKRALTLLADKLHQGEEEQQHRVHLTEPIPPLAAALPFLAPPRPVCPLVGRSPLLAKVKQDLLSAGEEGSVALWGLPGVGKTALAVELAHDPELRNHFDDGLLWAGLGRQPDLMPLLGIWAAAVGIPIEAVAKLTTLSERAAAVHAAIGLRRMLLVIDDAWQIEAALVFKLGGPNCVHLLTTRFSSVALDFAGAQVMHVHELDLAQGLDLLAQLSPQAVAAEPEEARTLVQLVGGLPLALLLMGRYLRQQSYAGQPRRLRQALTYLQTAASRLQLAQPHSPLEAQTGSALSTPLSLQASIGLNDAALDAPTHQALLDLSLFPPKPNSFSEAAALAVIDAPVSVLDTLVDHGLVESLPPERYVMHQTIADYAALLGASPDASERLAAYFVYHVEAHAAQHSLLDRDFSNILAALTTAFNYPLPDLYLRGVNAFHSFLEMRGLYQLDVQLLRQAYPLTEASQDTLAQATLLYNLGDLDIKLGQFREAQSYFRQSLNLAQRTEARQLAASGLFGLGLASWYLGGQSKDECYFERALQLFQDVGDRYGLGYALNGLGYACVELGDFKQALAYLEQALRVCRESGNRRGEGWAHYNLGTAYLPLGNFAQTETQWARCGSIYRELGDRRGAGWLIYNLGRLQRQRGQYDQAGSSFAQALQIFKELGEHFGQGWATHNLGLVAAETNDNPAAVAYFEQALQLFLEIGCRTGEHQIYHSQGVLFRRRGDYTEARAYLERALQFRQEIGYKRGEGKTLAHLGLVYFFLGDLHRALECGRAALCAAQQIGARPNQAHALTCLGQILVGLDFLDQAEDTYHQAKLLRLDLGQPHLALEAQAGLARVFLAQRRLPQALVEVEEILAYLAQTPPLEHKVVGVEAPGQFYLNCYQVLQAHRDSRADALFSKVRQFSQELSLSSKPD